MTINEQEIDPIDFPSYLASQPLFPKWYQKCRETGDEIAALGALESFSYIPDPLRSERIYGALSFPSQRKEVFWNNFPPCYFFLPQVEIIKSQNKTIRRVRGTPTILDTLPLQKGPIHLSPFPTHFPSYEIWNDSVEQVLQSIGRQEIQKLVLARKSSFLRQGEPYAWLAHLINTAKGSTVFAMQMTPSSLFLGATPENLYRRHKREIKTESIAGTQKRNGSTSILQTGEKEHREVECVKSFLEEALSSCCEVFSSEKTCSFVQTSHLEHLRYRLQGHLKSSVLDQDLLSLLHPTPAVGGLPKKRSLEILSSLESFDRGLYAGAMGWISQEDSSFAVTIRSALIESNFLHAFAGAGIVEGSQAEKEWLELDSKIAHWSPLCHL